MPKPHNFDTIYQAAFDLYGLKFGYLTSYNRTYVRKNGKFVPLGYELTLYKSEITNGKLEQEETIRYATDEELKI